MILFSNTGSDPRAVMIEFSNTFSAIIAVLGSILDPTIANVAEIKLSFLETEKLILFKSGILKAWIFACGQHKVSVDDEKGNEGDDVDMFMLEEVIVLIEGNQDEKLHHEIYKKTCKRTCFGLQSSLPAALHLLTCIHLI